MFNQKGAIPLFFLIAVIGLISFLAITTIFPFKEKTLQTLFPKTPSQAANSFYESFSGQPTTPARFWNDSSIAANWDVVANQSDSGAVGSSENGDFGNPYAHHGADCSPPLDANSRLVTHPINNIHDAVYLCKDHIMTSLLAGYAVVYLTPNHKVDLTTGETVIRFDLTTLTTSGRDWVDIWITPLQDSFVLPLERWNAPYNGEPKNAVHIRTDGNNDGSPHWEGEIYRNHTQEGIGGGGNFYGGFKTALERSGALVNGSPAPVSPQRRDTFELRISRTSAKMCLVSVNVNPPVPTNQCFFDTTFADLGPSYANALVQFGHHAYNPQKDCSPSGLGGHYLNIDCLANTWHWDEVKITPATPFTIIKPTPSSPKFITRDMSITLNSPTPANSYLKFAAVAGNVEVSFNNGTTWTTIPRQSQVRNAPEHFSNYWGAIPAGVTTIKFRGANAASWLGRFVVQHVAVYSTNNATGTPLPTIQPTSTPTPQPTSTPTSTPTGSITIDFNSRAAGVLSGEFPAGVLSWGANWIVSGPFGQFNSNSISFSGASVTQSNFNILSNNQTLSSLQAFNGGTTATTITLTCTGNPTRTQSIAANTLVTITTGWTNPCTAVTISSSNSWDTNFDNLVLGPVIQPSPTPLPTPTPQPSIKTGDLNNDSVVNALDFAILLSKWGSSDSTADLNGDGTVGLVDFSILLSKWGT